MAKVTLPLFSGTVSGSIGGVTFYRRGNSNVCRLRVKPANPRTQKQIVARAILGGLSRLFSGASNVQLYKYDTQDNQWEQITVSTGLTSSERATWKSVGEFIKYNYARLKAGLDIVKSKS